MRFRTSWRVAAVLVAMLVSGRAGAADAPAGVAGDGIDARIQARMAESGLVGVGAAVIIDRKVAWSKGYGFADKQRGVPFTPDTVMAIGSISKTFTGVAMMQAVQDGRLSLDEDITRYLPFKVVHPAFPEARITLRQLATHTSGITDRWAVYERLYHWGGDAPETLGDFLSGYLIAGGKDYAPENFVPHAPGTHREYSNIGAALAGYIVERAVGEPLNTYTRRTIFAPLRMARSGWLLSEVPAGAHATLYVAQDGFSIPLPPYGLTTYPDGGVRTSVAELSRFFIALLGGGQYQGARILQPASAAEMMRLQYTAANKPDNIVLAEKNSGLFWATKYDGRFVGHGGSDPGVRTEMLATPAGDVAVVLFTNTSLAERDGKVYAELFKDVWEHAQALKSAAK